MPSVLPGLAQKHESFCAEMCRLGLSLDLFLATALVRLGSRARLLGSPGFGAPLGRSLPPAFSLFSARLRLSGLLSFFLCLARGLVLLLAVACLGAEPSLLGHSLGFLLPLPLRCLRADARALGFLRFLLRAACGFFLLLAFLGFGADARALGFLRFSLGAACGFFLLLAFLGFGADARALGFLRFLLGAACGFLLSPTLCCLRAHPLLLGRAGLSGGPSVTTLGFPAVASGMHRSAGRRRRGVSESLAEPAFLLRLSRPCVELDLDDTGRGRLRHPGALALEPAELATSDPTVGCSRQLRDELGLTRARG